MKSFVVEEKKYYCVVFAEKKINVKLQVFFFKSTLALSVHSASCMCVLKEENLP